MKFERRLHNGKWAAYVRVLGIWWSVPIGWVLADAFGVWLYFARRREWLGA